MRKEPQSNLNFANFEEPSPDSSFPNRKKENYKTEERKRLASYAYTQDPKLLQ